MCYFFHVPLLTPFNKSHRPSVLKLHLLQCSHPEVRVMSSSEVTFISGGTIGASNRSIMIQPSRSLRPAEAYILRFYFETWPWKGRIDYKLMYNWNPIHPGACHNPAAQCAVGNKNLLGRTPPILVLYCIIQTLFTIPMSFVGLYVCPLSPDQVFKLGDKTVGMYSRWVWVDDPSQKKGSMDNVWYICLHEWLICMVNVGKSTSPMDPMGHELENGSYLAIHFYFDLTCFPTP